MRLKALSALVVVAPLVAQVLAQSGRVRERPRPADPPNDPLKLRVEEVLLPVSVRNVAGRVPGSLDESDLIVTEDGKRQRINAIMRAPANVLFILDSGGESPTKNIAIHRDLALELIQALGPEDRAAVISYGDGVNLLSGWTKERKELEQAVRWKFRPGLMSEFYASLDYAAEELLPRVSGRRCVVIIGDGVDSFDSHRFEQVLAAFHRARATVYVAGPNAFLMADMKPEAYNALSWFEMIDPRARLRIERMRAYYRQLEASQVTLKGLAEETGGAAWYPTSVEEFRSLGSQIKSEINTEYVVAYQSQRPLDDSKFHAIQVSVTRPDLQIRCRRGVYSNVVRSEAGNHAHPKGSSFMSPDNE